MVEARHRLESTPGLPRIRRPDPRTRLTASRAWKFAFAAALLAAVARVLPSAADPLPSAAVLGVNADFTRLAPDEVTRAVERLEAAGIQAVRHPVYWSEIETRQGVTDWSALDRIAAAFAAADIAWVASVQTSPEWSRRDPPPPSGWWVCDDPAATERSSADEAPPTDAADLARFAGTLAERYAGRLWAVEVWPEANVLPHWRATGPDPEAYAEFLKPVATEIRARAPGTLVVSGAPAPNVDLGVCYLSDAVFLDRVALSGGLDAVDAVGVQAMGLRVGPHDTLSGDEPLGFRRAEVIEDRLRRRGVDKPLWAMTWGWRASDASSDRTPWGGHPPERVARWTREAYGMARGTWPWMGPMFLWHLQPDAPVGDPRWGFALWGPDGGATETWDVLRNLVAGVVPEGKDGGEPVGMPAAPWPAAPWPALVAAGIAVVVAWWARARIGPPLVGILARLEAMPAWVAVGAYAGAVAATATPVGWSNLAGVGSMVVLGAARPAVAVAAVAAAAPFWSRATLHVAAVPVRPVELLVAIAVAARILRWYARGGVRPAVRITWLDGLAVALVGWAALSLLWSERPEAALYEWRTVIAGPIAFYLLLRVGRRRETSAAALDGLVFGGAVAALWALVALAAVSFGNADGAVAAEGVLRANGPYASPNNLALLLGRLVPLTVALAAWGRGRRRRAYAVAALPIAAALFATFSRGALFVGLPLTAVYLAVMMGPAASGRRLRRAALAGALALAGVVALLLPFAGTQRVRSVVDARPGSTLFIRLRLWESALEMARDHPALGVGLDNFLYLYSERYVQRDAVQERFLSHPHNAVLDWWLRLGVPGLAIFAGLGLGNLLVGVRAARSVRPAHRALAVGALGMQVYALAHGMVDNVFFLVDLAIVWWVGQAALLALADDSPHEPREAESDVR